MPERVRAQSILDAIEVIRPLGRGAASSVLHVRHKPTGREYALKVVVRHGPDDDRFIEQVRNEYEVGSRLDHPNLVKVHELQLKKALFGLRVREARLVIELFGGRPLEECRALAVEKLISICRQVAEGMAHMHARGVFHADMKPDNVLVSPLGRAKIIDYGLCWIRGRPKGRVQGTPSYLAPEQGQFKTVNERTDIYNLGATMYRTFTGLVPPNRFSSGGATLTYLPVPPRWVPPLEANPQLPPDLAELIARCCAEKPDDRPATMKEVVQALVKLEG